MTTPTADTPAYFTGLDLGRPAEFTALVVLERTTPPGGKEFHFACRHLRRWPPSTPYPDVVGEVRTLFAAPPLASRATLLNCGLPSGRLC
jgi:hypothetical protein